MFKGAKLNSPLGVTCITGHQRTFQAFQLQQDFAERTRFNSALDPALGPDCRRNAGKPEGPLMDLGRNNTRSGPFRWARESGRLIPVLALNLGAKSLLARR